MAAYEHDGMRDCRQCSGTGRCFPCGGSGDFAADTGSGSDCPSCGGTGRCILCLGRGEVSQALTEVIPARPRSLFVR